jgi:hypothetical protein
MARSPGDARSLPRAPPGGQLALGQKPLYHAFEEHFTLSLSPPFPSYNLARLSDIGLLSVG